MRVLAGIGAAALMLTACVSSAWAVADTPAWGARATISDADSRNITSLRLVTNEAGTSMAVWNAFIDGRRQIRASSREFRGVWSQPQTVTEVVFKKDVTLAIDSAGNVTALWIRKFGNTSLGGTIEAATFIAARGSWTPPEAISAPGVESHQPKLVTTPDGTVIAAWTSGSQFTPPGITQATVAVRSSETGRWSLPEAIGLPRSGAGALRVNGKGDAVLITGVPGAAVPTLESRIRPVGGDWGSPSPLVIRRGTGIGDVAIGPDQELVFIAADSEDPDFPETQFLSVAERPPSGSWTALRKLEGSDAFDTGDPTVKFDAEGRVTIAWRPVRGRTNGNGGFVGQVATATREVDGTWSPVDVLSDPNRWHFGPSLVLSPTGEAVIRWVNLFRPVGSIYLSSRRAGPNAPWSPRERIQVVANSGIRELVGTFDSAGRDTQIWATEPEATGRVRAADRSAAALGTIRLTRSQLLTNQRVAQAALRRATAALERVRGGLTGADVRDGALDENAFAADLSVTGSASGGLVPPGSGRPIVVRPPEPRSGRVDLSVDQLRINQRIAQAALRRVDAVNRGLALGLTGSHFLPGSITATDFAPGIAVTPTGQDLAVDGSDIFNVRPPGTRRGKLELTADQLRVNQKISQEAVRRANALIARLEAGLTGADIRTSGINSSAVDLGAG